MQVYNKCGSLVRKGFNTTAEDEVWAWLTCLLDHGPGTSSALRSEEHTSELQSR